MENPSTRPCRLPGVHNITHWIDTEAARRALEIPAPAQTGHVLAPVVLVGKDAETLENLSGRAGGSRAVLRNLGRWFFEGVP